MNAVPAGYGTAVRHHVAEAAAASDSEREQWNRRYRERDFGMREKPSYFLAEQLPLFGRVLTGRRALDVACGEGRNSLFLAQRGFDVTAVDNSDVALNAARLRSQAAGLSVDYRLLDLRESLPAGQFDLIIVFNFLLRDLVPKLAEALVPGGHLVMEARLNTAENPGCHRREFVLGSGELLELVQPLAGCVVMSRELPEIQKARVVFRRA